MFSTFRSIWIWTANAVLFVVWLIVMGVVRLLDRDPRHLRTARVFRSLGPALGKINPWRVRVAGSERVQSRQAYVIVSNHQSFADIPVVAHVKVDSKWLFKAELARVPVVGWMLRMADDVPVDRKDRRSGGKALLQCARYLRQNCSIVCFPEGTRSKDGSVLPFNDGPFQLAVREKVPVLPMVVEGSGSALPKHTWRFGPPQDVHLHVLEPVAPDGLQPAELRDAVRQRMIDELAAIRNAS